MLSSLVLCFSFVTRPGLVKTPEFYLLLKGAYTVSRPYLLLTLPPSSRKDGCGQEVGRGHSLDSWLELIRDIPHHLTSCSAIKLKGRMVKLWLAPSSCSVLLCRVTSTVLVTNARCSTPEKTDSIPNSPDTFCDLLVFAGVIPLGCVNKEMHNS